MDILEFSTVACTYCRITHSHVVGYAMDHNMSLQKVNADNETNSDAEKALCRQYDVQSVPVVVLHHESDQPHVLRGFADIMREIRE